MIVDDLGVGERSATEVLTAMVAAFATGDPTDAATFVSEDYLDHQGLGEGPISGVDGFARVVRTNHAAYLDQEITIQDVFGIPDRAVARIRWHGRRADGEEVDRETIDIVRVVAGLAVEHWGGHS